MLFTVSPPLSGCHEKVPGQPNVYSDGMWWFCDSALLPGNGRDWNSCKRMQNHRTSTCQRWGRSWWRRTTLTGQLRWGCQRHRLLMESASLQSSRSALPWRQAHTVTALPAALPTGPGMVMVSPVPRRVPVIAPMVISLIIMSMMMGAVVPPAHHDDRCWSDHDGSRYAEAHGHTGACVGRLGWREQRESQECDYTTHTYNMFDTFHGQFLPMKRRLCAASCSVMGRRLPHVRSFVAHASRRTPEERSPLSPWLHGGAPFLKSVCSGLTLALRRLG